MTLRSTYTAFFLFAAVAAASAQKDDKNIGTEVVNVVKSYTPTISDAFKVKETPVLDDEETLKKETIEYQIFSFPVASTFAPAKGRAASVDKEEKEKLYDNYLTLGFGNYSNANAELFVNHDLGDNSYVGGMLRHFSSQGGIDEARLEDKFAETSLDLGYGYRADNLHWTADVGFKNSVYNWYGVDRDLENILPDFYDDAEPKHTFNELYVGTRVRMTNSFFKEATFKYDRFWDDFDGAENRLYLKPSFAFHVGEHAFRTDVIVDYLGGSFLDGTLDYGYTNFGVKPSYTMRHNDWTIDLGIAAFYSADNEGGDSRFAVYPAVNASLKVVGDLMVFYAGAEGTMQQNTYRDFAAANPFVAPLLGVAPTDRKYDVFAGLKGKLASSISYNLRGSFVNENDRAMFRHNMMPDPGIPAEREGYQYGNAFDVVYDDVKTFRFFGELKADFSKSVSFGVNGTFSAYETDGEEEAWNLPTLELGTTLDIDITPKWYAGFKIFYVGERHDRLLSEDLAFVPETVTLDPYFDANAHIGYRHNERWSAFLKFNNIAGKSYEKWLYYPVQSFQAMIGANYKFDF